jgi:hypothetical protein
LAQVAATPRSVGQAIATVLESADAVEPGLHDWFFLDRLMLLVEAGRVRFSGDDANSVQGIVQLP